jgi:flagellar motility protein MotE (MotC chaperone)
MPAPVRKPRPKLDRVSNADTARGPALRILPLVIIAAVCMLGFRIQVVVNDFADKSGPMLNLGQPALAQNSAAQTNEAEQPTAEPKEDEGEAAEEPAAEEAAATAEKADADAGPLKPSELTKSEIETLQRLAERRQIIETRERELQQKESLLKAAEQRMDQKIAQMQEIEKQLQGLVQQYDAKKKTEIEQLVKIYTAMKPKDAARIFDDLDMNLLVPVVTSMKEAKVAPILSLMKADKARELTEEMSTRRKLPGDNG